MEYEILIFLFHFLYHLLSHFLFHFLYRVTIVWRPRICRHGLEEMGTGPGRWGQALAGEKRFPQMVLVLGAGAGRND